jgi:hypothetical protein
MLLARSLSMASNLKWSETRPDRAHGDPLTHPPHDPPHIERWDGLVSAPGDVEHDDELRGTREPAKRDPEAERKKHMASFATPVVIGLAFALLVAGGLLAPMRSQAAFVLMTVALIGFAVAAIVTAMVSLRTRRAGNTPRTSS